jgi:hypothetical protein
MAASFTGQDGFVGLCKKFIGVSIEKVRPLVKRSKAAEGLIFGII